MEVNYFSTLFKVMLIKMNQKWYAAGSVAEPGLLVGAGVKVRLNIR